MKFTWPWKRKASAYDLLREALAKPLKSGAVVNTTTALEVSTVLSCARAIAEGIAQIPFRVHLKNGRDRIEADEHDLYWLLAKRPNEWQSSFEFREQIGLHLALCNSAYVFKNIVRGRVVELLPYEPGCVTVRRLQDMSLEYDIRTADGKQITVQQDQMWHIRGLSWNGWMGLETIKLAREAIGLAMATEEHSARMFSNGARVGGVLSTDSVLKEDQVNSLRTSWEATQGGNANAFKTAILWGGLKWNPTGFGAEQAQLIESRRNQVEEICRAFRVMPIMVGFSDKAATYASAEAMFDAHIKHTMLPWYKRLEDSADINLLGMEQVKRGYYTKFNANALLRGSVKDRGDYYTKMYNIGALNPNEIRELEDMNPYDGGDKYRVPLNMVDPASETPTDTGEDQNAKA